MPKVRKKMGRRLSDFATLSVTENMIIMKIFIHQANMVDNKH